jgi:hypothetical protein
MNAYRRDVRPFRSGLFIEMAFNDFRLSIRTAKTILRLSTAILRLPAEQIGHG